MTRRSIGAMAMEFTVEAHGADGAVLDAAVHHVVADLRWVDEVFSTYRPESWISRLGRGEVAVEQCPPAVAEVLDLCERFRTETDGAFDARRPHRDGEAALIDPTGIVKTWAMERVRWRWDLAGATGYLWGCAGDAMVSGSGPVGGRWRIGISDPRLARADAPVIDVVELGPGAPTAIATSGIAHDAGHIWTPDGGAPHYAQVSVVGTDLVECDAWATAVLAGGPALARRAADHGIGLLACRVTDGQLAATSTPAWRSRMQ